MSRGRKRTIIGEKIQSLYNDAKEYRERAKRMTLDVEPLRKLEAYSLALDIPLPEKEYNISYSYGCYVLDYESEEHRAVLGKAFNVPKWDRNVCEYSGLVSLRAKVDTPIGQIHIELKNAALANGCRMEEYTEQEVVTRKRFRSVCNEQE